MRIPVTQLGNVSKAVVLGDFLLLYISKARWEKEPSSLCQVHLVAWKEGSVTLVSTANSFFLYFMAYNDGQLRDILNQGYGHIPVMISEDIVVLARLNPPGIENCAGY
jgi:hypothetical protein